MHLCMHKEVPRLEQGLIALYVCLPLASLLLLIEYLVVKDFSYMYSKCVYNEKVQKCLTRVNVV
jgi:hypothetical protein